MKIGILGTGMVGSALGTALVERGHSVMMGSRSADNPKAAEWMAKAGANASQGTFADAAQFGAVVLNCTSGGVSLEALEMAGAKNLASKILIDVANPLDFSHGMPPTLSVCNTDSLGEQIQNAFPDAKVVKTLNTVNASLMTNPKLVPGDHVLFICGNDAAAREQVTTWLNEWFGWEKKNVLDMGDITNARATEMLLPIWIRLYGKFQSPMFNFQIARANG